MLMVGACAVIGALIAWIFFWYCDNGYRKRVKELRAQYGHLPVDAQIEALELELVRVRRALRVRQGV
jgi:peptidoglycan/LPS O-acetylase OafA/YrhL